MHQVNPPFLWVSLNLVLISVLNWFEKARNHWFKVLSCLPCHPLWPGFQKVSSFSMKLALIYGTSQHEKPILGQFVWKNCFKNPQASKPHTNNTLTCAFCLSISLSATNCQGSGTTAPTCMITELSWHYETHFCSKELYSSLFACTNLQNIPIFKIYRVMYYKKPSAPKDA